MIQRGVNFHQLASSAADISEATILLLLPYDCFSDSFMLQPGPVSQKPDLTRTRDKVSLTWAAKSPRMMPS